MSTNFPGAVDDALVMGASYTFDANDRRKIDDQIRAVQQVMLDHVVSTTEAGYWVSGGTLAVGDVACMNVDGQAVLANAANLAIAKAAIGVVLVAVGGPGQRVLIATRGAVDAAVTGLDPALSNFVRVDANGRCEYVATLGPSDVGLGYAILGQMLLQPGLGGGGTRGVSYSTDDLTVGDGTTTSITFTTDQGQTVSLANTMAGSMNSVFLMATTTQFAIADGDATNPALRFNQDSDTGLFRSGPNMISITCGTVPIGTISSTSLTIAGQVLADGGSNLLPGFAFDSNPDTGLYDAGAGTLNVSVDGDLVASFRTALADTETALLLRVDRGGVESVDQVTFGAVDSGGVGYRVLRVPN